MTSCILPPRRALALCSPSTQRMESAMLDLPQPLGPTMAVTPGSKRSVEGSAKDLKPCSFRALRYMEAGELNGPVFARQTETARSCSRVIPNGGSATPHLDQRPHRQVDQGRL